MSGNERETVALTKSHLAGVTPEEPLVVAWLADDVTRERPVLAVCATLPDHPSLRATCPILRLDAVAGA